MTDPTPSRRGWPYETEGHWFESSRARSRKPRRWWVSRDVGCLGPDARPLYGPCEAARRTMASFMIAMPAVFGWGCRSQPAREHAGQIRDHHPGQGQDHQHAYREGAQRQRPRVHYGAKHPENQGDHRPGAGPGEKGHLVPRWRNSWSRRPLVRGRHVHAVPPPGPSGTVRRFHLNDERKRPISTAGG
jgi:hypothetical protein